jgi:hypothetical protein
MSEDQSKKPSTRSAVPWGVAVVVLCWPAGSLVGMLLGLVSDFGLDNTAENIRANPEIFANQYAGPLVHNGWTAAGCLLVVAIIVGIQLWKRGAKEGA